MLLMSIGNRNYVGKDLVQLLATGCSLQPAILADAPFEQKGADGTDEKKTTFCSNCVGTVLKTHRVLRPLPCTSQMHGVAYCTHKHMQNVLFGINGNAIARTHAVQPLKGLGRGLCCAKLQYTLWWSNYYCSQKESVCLVGCVVPKLHALLDATLLYIQKESVCLVGSALQQIPHCSLLLPLPW